jgi:glycosyltransferase involved in cell wall biosynthesis
METLSILIMNWRDIRNPDAGGAEVFTHEVARRWASRGHNVSLLTSRFEGSLTEEIIDGVRVVRNGNRFAVYSRTKQAYLRTFRSGIDLVIDEINTRPFFAPQYVNGGAIVYALIFQLAREFWSYETPFPVSVIGRYWLEERWLRAYRDLPTFTVSQSTHADLLALGFRNIIVVPVGLSIKPDSELPIKESKPTLVFVGRLKRAKLPDHAIQAFSILRQSLPNAQLWVIGDGYLRPGLERRAPKGVVFFGRLPEGKKVELIRRAHLLLCPAVREGWGLTITEASALGTPAIGYQVPGTRDAILDGETGFLVPFGATGELARTALRVMTNEELKERISRNCLAHAKKFDWDVTANQMMEFMAKRM